MMTEQHKNWAQKFPEKVAANNRKQDRKRGLRRGKVIDWRGGKCEICGYKHDGENGFLFDFHHKDPEQMKFGINSSAMRKKTKDLLPEIDKCIMVCCMCHRKIHWGKSDIMEETKDVVSTVI